MDSLRLIAHIWVRALTSLGNGGAQLILLHYVVDSIISVYQPLLALVKDHVSSLANSSAEVRESWCIILWTFSFRPRWSRRPKVSGGCTYEMTNLCYPESWVAAQGRVPYLSTRAVYHEWARKLCILNLLISSSCFVTAAWPNIHWEEIWRLQEGFSGCKIYRTGWKRAKLGVPSEMGMR